MKGVRGLPRDRKTLGGEGASATVLGAHRRAPAQIPWDKLAIRGEMSRADYSRRRTGGRVQEDQGGCAYTHDVAIYDAFDALPSIQIFRLLHDVCFSLAFELAFVISAELGCCCKNSVARDNRLGSSARSTCVSGSELSSSQSELSRLGPPF